jgi:hypothetical protein
MLLLPPLLLLLPLLLPAGYTHLQVSWLSVSAYFCSSSSGVELRILLRMWLYVSTSLLKE